MGLPVSRVAVKFLRHVQLPYTSGAERAFEGDDAARWRDIAPRVDGSLEPLFDLPEGALDRLLDRGRKSKDIQPPHLKGWFTIGCPADAAVDLIATLRKWPVVDAAYVMPDAPPTASPGVAFANDPAATGQGFQRDAPEGVDVRYAWRYPGGNGEGTRIFVVDNSFDLSHQDLSHPVAWPFGPGDVTLFGTGDPASGDFGRQHGAAALAVMMARDNSIGGVGMVPMARAVASSTFDTRRTPVVSTALAIANAAAVDPILDLGRDVIVLVVGFTESLDDQNPDPTEPNDRRPMLPAEAEPAVFDAIQAAVAAGIVVVEPAGNSDVNLDLFRRDGRFPMDRTSPDFRDSGAIIVGGCFSGFDGKTPLSRVVFDDLIPGTSRRRAVAFGNRIDCFARADNVQTGLVGAGGNFGITGASATIVAGAAASLQGIVKRDSNAALPPLRVRELFSDPRFNTPSHNPPEDRIGVMPDLRRLIREALGIRPHIGLLVSDFVGDSGIPSPSVQLGQSPDIVVSLTELANPQEALGSVSRPGLPASLSDPCFVYLRSRNFGRDIATNIRADVFWAATDHLSDPSRWHLIGSTTFPAVDPDSQTATVSGAVRWDLGQAGSPGIQGSYMLIAVVTNDPDDPMPSPLGPFGALDDFRAFVGRHSAVATRQHTLYAVEDTWWGRWRRSFVRILNWAFRRD